MIGYLCKDEASRLLRPIDLYLKKKGVHPNHLTMFGLIFSLAAALAYSFGRLRLGGLALLAAGISDTLDGSLARNTGTSSPFGAFIDSVTDRYSEFFVFSGLLFYFNLSGQKIYVIILMAALMGSIMVSYTRARAESIIDECRIGLMERPERMIVLILFSLIGSVKPALWILAVGANVTAIRRILHTYHKT